MKKVILEAKNVGVCYPLRRQIFTKSREIWAIKDLSFELYEGEKLGIIGRNGTGKSTLMKLLAGIFSPSKGKLTWKQTTNIQLLTLGVGFEGSLSGRENAILNGMLLGYTRRTMLKRVEAIKEFSELGDFFEYPVNTYSSGMVVRLGFSVAMQCNPEVLLLDELLGVGDASFQKKSEQTLMDKFHSSTTVVMISHDAAQIEKLCSRVLWLEQGMLVAEGNTAEVMAKYNESLISHAPSKH
jgi:lipopolysaccharide transport system ATP-binding protein